MAAAVPAMIAASSAVSAYGAMQQGDAARAAGEYNARMAEQNAAIARQETALQIQQLDRENYLRLGAVRAAQGKSGGEADTGSSFDVIGDVAAQGALERQYAAWQGANRAQGFVNTARLDRMEGRAAQTASRWRAGSELLGGGANAYIGSTRLARL